MNSKAKKTKKQASVQNPAINILSKEEHGKKMEALEKSLHASTWRELAPPVNFPRTTNFLLSLMRCL